ncbi:MAG: hypothetical protein NTY98_02885, partial [Verrucomicrobia bacterium]|nr:hypothetical protein [Verrucomicrobiota bacterium]
MAFIFSTSHLPETRVRRPDHLEDEEEEPSAPRQTAAGSPKGERSESTRMQQPMPRAGGMQQPMPRAGGVRAFSHLPVRDNPAPSTGPLREDSPRGEIGPIPPRSATPSTSGSPMSEPQDDAPPPEADSDPEDDTAPQDHADDRPWYMPRITAQDLPPQDHPEDAHATSPKPWENTSPNSRFDAAPHADRSTSSNGFSPSPQNLRDDFHATTPDSPTREAPAQDSRPALTRGRIFEQRSAPAAFLMQQQSKGASGSTSRQRLQVSQQALAAQPQPVRGTTPPANGNTPAAQPQALAQAQRPAANPAQNAPAAPQPPTGGPAVKQAQTPQFQVDEADENTQFDLTDQDTGKLLQTGVKFGDHARSVINEEIENSPVAIAALNRARELSKKNVVVHLTNDEQATPRIGLDGTIHIYVNPKTLK